MTDTFWIQAFGAAGVFITTLGGVAISYARQGKLQSIRNSIQLGEIHEKVNGGLDKAVREARRQREPQVLVVDDDDNDLLLARRPLEAFGCEVHEAKTLEVTRELILYRIGSARGMPFDFILLDMRMPGSDTMEFLEMFDLIAPRIPVVIITGYPNDPRLNEILNTPRTWITKPLTEFGVKRLLEYFAIPYYKRPSTL